MAASCQAPTYAAPRVAAWDMSRDTTAARLALLAKFDFVVINHGPSALGAVAASLRQSHPTMHIAKYLSVADLRPTATSAEENSELVRQLDANQWWLTTAEGKAASWTGGTTVAINATAWTGTDSAGRRWPQFKAQYDARTWLAPAPAIDYVFASNALARPRVSADWRRQGSDQAPSDAQVQAAMRAGFAAYWSALRVASPGVKVMAGPDNDLSSPEYQGQADAAYLDGMIGQPWSRETWAGWDDMMRHYRTALANLKPGKQAIFAVYGKAPTDYATLRYGIASALLDDGVFMFRPLAGSPAPARYDEYLAPLGKAIDAPPAAATSNGIWMRRFENGLVLVNPQKVQATIDVGAGYKRLAGSQDPAVNNGQQQQLVTLGARQGLVMLRVPAPCTATSYATPRVAALDFSRNISDARKALLAKFDVVILGLGQSLGASAIDSFVRGVKGLNPATMIGQYTLLNEAKCDAPVGDEKYPVWRQVELNNWWLRTANGARVQWTDVYGACDINISSYMPPNGNGQTYPQWKWLYDRSTLISKAPFDFVFSDNTFGKTRNAADWKRVHVDSPAGDAEASAAMRKGHVAYWQALRSTDPQLKIVGNADNDLSWPEYSGGLDGVYLEGSMGKSWSKETWAGWQGMMDYYRGALRNTRQPNLVFLSAYGDPGDYATMRYGLASAMMEDGRYVFVPPTGTMQSSWYDEFGAPIGAAAEPPPTAAAQNGVWMRRYANGLALVNPSKTASASIDVGPGYRRLAGTQDPGVNNGQAQEIVTLGPRQGLLMIRQ